MKRFFLIFMGVIVFNFTGCGGGSSDEAKELLTHNLKLVGIPQEIVVNICQDDNDNGSCDAGEFQAKVKVSSSDTIAQMWEKVKFDADGRYVLQNYDPTKNIIMEIDGKQHEKYNNVDLALKYKPTTQELSVLQAVVDADFLKEEEVTKLKALNNREEIDRVLFNSLTKNQALLEEQNLSTKTALNINLEEIAKGLIDSNVSDELPTQLQACENNSSCIEDIVNNTSDEVELTKEEAEELAKSKNLADGYIVGLSKAVVAVCSNGKEYKSELKVGAKGKIDFKTFPVGTDCNITVSSGATIDSNNNGELDDKDKQLEFDMIGSSDDIFISPLTTLLFKKRKKGEDVKEFAQMIQNFDPVTAPSRTLTNTGVEKVKIEKLIVLMEVLKTSMKESADISKLDLSQIIVTKKDETIDSLDINRLIKSLPADMKTTISEKAGKIKQIIKMLKDLDSKKVSIDSFVVGVSDGGKGIKNSLTSSLFSPLPEGVSILDFVNNSSNISANSTPTAKAGADKTITEGESITLDGSKSIDSDGDIVYYEWWDRDKEAVIEKKATITLDNLPLGIHNFTLFVKDNKGAVGKDNIVITIVKKDIGSVVENGKFTKEYLSGKRYYYVPEYGSNVLSISIGFNLDVGIIEFDTNDTRYNIEPINEEGRVVVANTPFTLEDGVIHPPLIYASRTFSKISLVRENVEGKYNEIEFESSDTNRTERWYFRKSDALDYLGTKRDLRYMGSTTDALIYPNGTERWIYNANENIKWSIDKLTGDTVNLYVLHDDPSDLYKFSSTAIELLNSKTWYKFKSTLPNKGNYIVDPIELNGHGDAYVILIVDSDGNWDVSDSSVTLMPSSNKESSVKKTGQTKSYNNNGDEITNGSQKDDGFYQKGVEPSYSRDDEKEIVTDNLTNLMWQDDSAVESIKKQWTTQENYDAKDYNNTIGDTATTYCNELNLGGYEDWRLPTRQELQGIVDYGRNKPAMSPVFVIDNSQYYWSSTTDKDRDLLACFVGFESGFQNSHIKTMDYYVRCVR